MILQTSVVNQIETILVLSATLNKPSAENCCTISDLKSGYRQFLKHLNQRPINSEGDQLEWVSNLDEAASLQKYFSNDSLLDDRAQGAVISGHHDDACEEKKERILEALHELTLYSPAHADLFNTTITDILILPSNVAKGGSTSQAIGVIWANPKLTYKISDIVEILVHEYSHNAMFLDELRYTHYSYQKVLDRSTWAYSAILNVLRPLDKVLHSIVVSIEILLFRKYFLGHPVKPRIHPPTPVMVSQLREAILSTEAALLGSPEVLCSRAIDLLNNAKQILYSNFSEKIFNLHDALPLEIDI